jgi:hypothetical protein
VRKLLSIAAVLFAFVVPSHGQEIAAGTSVQAISPAEAISVATILPSSGIDTVVTRSIPQGIAGTLNRGGTTPVLNSLGSASRTPRRSIDGTITPRPENSLVQNRVIPAQNRPDGSWSVGSRLQNARDGSRDSGNLISTRRTNAVGGTDAF